MAGPFISPEALILHGELAGLSGSFFLPLLAAGIALHWINVSALQDTKAPDPAGLNEIQVLTEAYGKYTAALLLLAARPALVLCLATAVLVTAGYVFNEVFLYWFPNFGFAALLLIIIVALNLAGPRTAAAAQVLFTVTAVAGLAGVAIVGLFFRNAAGIDTAPELTWVAAGRSIGLAALAFVGYDMLRYTENRLDATRVAGVVKSGLVAGGGLFILWNLASLWHLGPSRLAETGIPHLLTAKAIMGTTGRIIMGVTVIAGACAAVNYLFHSLARSMAAMARCRLLPAAMERSPDRPILALLILAAGTGLLMAAGLAGSHRLDVGIRASFIAWLLFYALRHLAEYRRRRRPTAGRLGCRILAAVAMATIALLLLTVDDNPRALVTFLCAMLLSAAAFSGFGLLMARVGSLDTTAVSNDLKKGENP